MAASNETNNGLSPGDGVAVLGLCLLIIAWAVMALWMATTGDSSAAATVQSDDKLSKDDQESLALFLLAAVIVPPVLAAWAIYHIITRK
jgi:uncharacterized paraquat-inducible protein A